MTLRKLCWHYFVKGLRLKMVRKFWMLDVDGFPYFAEGYPKCHVTGLCNINEKCSERGFANVDIYADDISNFKMETFDRIISIEMFEHAKHYELLKKISLWMHSESLLFVPHFCHKTLAYNYNHEDVDEDDWMACYFFSGGTMLSSNMLLYFQDDVLVINHWLVNGMHYAQTSEEWLKRMDKNIVSLVSIFKETYGENDAKTWSGEPFLLQWQSSNNAEEWMVLHLLFKKKK